MSGGGKVNASATAAAAARQISMQNLQLPPLRTLDDFALGSARFQLPNLKDPVKWGNRVVKNLLYYQTNYFLLLLGIYGLMAVLHPVKIISGLLVQAKLLAVYVHFFCNTTGSKSSIFRTANTKGSTVRNEQQKWYFLAGTLLLGFLILHWLDAILLSCFTLLLPISLAFVHSSLRLRNIRNKVANTVESFGPSTPMGILLDALDVTVESLLN